ncbi:MAG: flagellar hook-basal body complex protein FliE [Woeseiaceae bacterium]
MNPINPEQLLSQIRSLNAELQGKVETGSAQANGAGFGDLLKQSISAVSATQQQAAVLKTGFENGANDANLVEVMVAAQKADLTFRAMTEVRNKLITAYQEIMNMPV